MQTEPARGSGSKGSGIGTYILVGCILLVIVCLLAVVIGGGAYLVFGRGGKIAVPGASGPATRAPRVDSTPTPRPTLTPPDTPTPKIILTPTFGIGSSWVRPADRMTMMYVPMGQFKMGYASGYQIEQPAHFVELDDFWIDQTEVTNAMFAKFVQATGYSTDAEQIGQSYVYLPGQYLPAAQKWELTAKADWRHPEGPASDWKPDDPVVQMSWNDAAAYCKWAGARLPTEAEWELAARGLDGRLYPWGNQGPNAEFANSADVSLDAIWTATYLDDGFKFSAPVGSFPAGASPYGLLDMAGNASEWVADFFQGDYYANSPHSNPTGPAGGTLKILRGGHWAFTADGLRSTGRVVHSPTYSIDYSGFRCARTP
jgi:formylglycine-generating enzyme required for sulfatase activity